MGDYQYSHYFQPVLSGTIVIIIEIIAHRHLFHDSIDTDHGILPSCYKIWIPELGSTMVTKHYGMAKPVKHWHVQLILKTYISYISILLLLLTWGHKAPCHGQSWCWPDIPVIFRFSKRSNNHGWYRDETGLFSFNFERVHSMPPKSICPVIFWSDDLSSLKTELLRVYLLQYPLIMNQYWFRRWLTSK